MDIANSQEVVRIVKTEFYKVFDKMNRVKSEITHIERKREEVKTYISKNWRRDDVGEIIDANNELFEKGNSLEVVYFRLKEESNMFKELLDNLDNGNTTRAQALLVRLIEKLEKEEKYEQCAVLVKAVH